MTKRHMDLFDDPAWPTTPTPPSAHRYPAALIPLMTCLIAAGGLLVSLIAPWYTIEGIASFPPDSKVLITGFVPGGWAWSILLFALACATLVVSALTVRLVTTRKIGPAELRTAPMALAGLATALLAVTLLEALARPPYGDGPPLTLDWGAPIGLITAVVSAAGAWWAVIVALRTHVEEQTSSAESLSSAL